LDAAHITPDREATSSTSDTNGLSLCKIHHPAYDINIIGIDSDDKVHVRDDILNEVDGPMLEHGIKEMNMRTLWIPRAKFKQTDRDRLEVRFQMFQAQ
jgi:putative restriction endonuclease